MAVLWRYSDLDFRRTGWVIVFYMYLEKYETSIKIMKIMLGIYSIYTC